MSAHEIPLRSTPQRFAITLGIGTILTFVWNKSAGCWVIDIDASGGVPILHGVPIVTGADLLEQFAYLGLGGALISQTDHDTDAVPTFTNLGTSGHLYFVTP